MGSSVDRGGGTVNDPVVGVVIPAYNSARTLAATLRSVLGQTHRALDVVVVDDGSTDATPDIVMALSRDDPRLRLLRQANAGTAVARDNGWRSCQAELIAFLDADDLWAPGKIERQLAELASGGPETGLVYSHYVRIDMAGRKVKHEPQTPRRGWVLDELLVENFVGNGSSALVRREVLERVGGFAGADHNCADWQFYYRVARFYQFGAVPVEDIGYRITPGAQSCDHVKMLRSALRVHEEVVRETPEHRALIDKGIWAYGEWLMAEAMSERRWDQVSGLVTELTAFSPDRAHLLPVVRRQGVRRLLAPLRRMLGRAKRMVQHNIIGRTPLFEIGG